MTDCKHAEEEIMVVVHAIESLTSPWELVYHVGKEIIVNHKDIFHDVEGAIENWDSKSYENFGKNIGDIIALLSGIKEPEHEIFPVVNSSDTKKTVELIFEGILLGFMDKEAPDAMACV